jgi:hypothetical protein
MELRYPGRRQSPQLRRPSHSRDHPNQAVHLVSAFDPLALVRSDLESPTQVALSSLLFSIVSPASDPVLDDSSAKRSQRRHPCGLRERRLPPNRTEQPYHPTSRLSLLLPRKPLRLRLPRRRCGTRSRWRGVPRDRSDHRSSKTRCPARTARGTRVSTRSMGSSMMVDQRWRSCSELWMDRDETPPKSERMNVDGGVWRRGLVVMA